MRLALLLVVVLVLPGALAAADVTTVRYVGGAARFGATSVGGICTSGSTQDGNQTPTDAPVVVGGACNVPTRNATQIDLAVVDDALGGMPFRYQFNGTAGCAAGGTGIGSVVAIAVPSACVRVSVYVAETGTSGLITVSRP